MKPYILRSGTFAVLLAGMCIPAVAQRPQPAPKPAPTPAQQPVQAWPDSTPRWDIAIGSDLLSWGSGGFYNQEFGQRTEKVPELSGMGSLRWPLGPRGMAFRAQLTAGTTFPDGIRLQDRSCRDVTNPGPSPTPPPLDDRNTCRVSMNHFFLGVSTSVLYEFRRTSTVRPYVTAGPGLYMTHLRRRPSDDVSSSSSKISTTDWTLGATAGIGVSVPVKYGMIFAEQSLLVPNILGTSPLARNKAPLFIGYRF